jgi:hypothetical protein
MQRRTVLAAGISFGLWGCGATPSGTTVLPAPPPPSIVTMPTELHAGPDERAITLTFQMAKAVAGLRTAHYMAETFCRGNVGKCPHGLTPSADGTWQGTLKASEHLDAPNSYTVTVAGGDDPTFTGTSLSIIGDSVRGVPGGWRSILPWHAHLADARMLDFRGHRRDEFDFGGLAHRLAGAATATYLGSDQWAGVAIDRIEVPRAPVGDPDVTREVLGLDATSHLPLVIERYTRTGLVYARRLRGLVTGGVSGS